MFILVLPNLVIRQLSPNHEADGGYVNRDDAYNSGQIIPSNVVFPTNQAILQPTPSTTNQPELNQLSGYDVDDYHNYQTLPRNVVVPTNQALQELEPTHAAISGYVNDAYIGDQTIPENIVLDNQV